MWQGEEYAFVEDNDELNVIGGASEGDAAEWIFTKVYDE